MLKYAHQLHFFGFVQPRPRCSAGSVYLEERDVCVCVRARWGVPLCCVYPIPVYLTRYLTSSFKKKKSWFHFLPALGGEEFIRARFFLFFFTPLCNKLLLSHFYAAGTFVSKWLSFRFLLVWADPCAKSQHSGIQYDCMSLKMSVICCHFLGICVTLCVFRNIVNMLLCKLAAVLFL